MSRSGYVDFDCCSREEYWDYICWRGAVKSALKGKRGQAFLKEMLAAMEALPKKELEAYVLVSDQGSCCAMGSVAISRDLDVSSLDPEDRKSVAKAFGIAEAMAAEIAFINDSFDNDWHKETPAQRYSRVKTWIEEQII